jgi:hypothetical protein
MGMSEVVITSQGDRIDIERLGDAELVIELRGADNDEYRGIVMREMARRVRVNLNEAIIAGPIEERDLDELAIEHGDLVIDGPLVTAADGTVRLLA